MMTSPDYDIEVIDSWSPPEHNGIELLGMMNVPHELHGLAPRTIMGNAKWNLVRKKGYMDANYACEICGKYLGHGNCALHEVYAYDYKKAEAEFVRYVCVCANDHNFIHSGRLLTLYANQQPGALDKMEMLKLVGDRFKLIAEYNRTHPEAIIRVSDTFIEWSKTMGLSTSMKAFFESYDVKFAKPYSTKKWRQWKLKVGDTWYDSPYKTRVDWERRYGRRP